MSWPSRTGLRDKRDSKYARLASLVSGQEGNSYTFQLLYRWLCEILNLHGIAMTNKMLGTNVKNPSDNKTPGYILNIF